MRMNDVHLFPAKQADEFEQIAGIHFPVSKIQRLDAHGYKAFLGRAAGPLATAQ